MFTILPNIGGSNTLVDPQVKHWRGPDPCDPCGVDAYESVSKEKSFQPSSKCLYRHVR